jgi:hypothetical protein
MNRHERRKAASLHKIGLRALKLRCVGCDRAGRTMSQEHFFPRWLIKHADVRRDGIEWLGKKGLNPEKATVPLCEECNNEFANTLEGPVSSILRGLESGEALSDLEAEIIVRWMWKFEGLQWSLYAPSEGRYTAKHSLRDRVTKPNAFSEIRERLLLAVAFCHANDPGFEDWPLGIDTPPGEDAITMSGVFRRTAIVTSLTDFADVIPDVFGKYVFGPTPEDRTAKVFLPPCSFLTANGAIQATKETALHLSTAHTALGRQLREDAKPQLVPVRYRVELPPV